MSNIFLSGFCSSVLFNIIKVLFLKDDVHFLPNPGKRPKPGIRRPLPSDDLIKMNSFRVKYG